MRIETLARLGGTVESIKAQPAKQQQQQQQQHHHHHHHTLIASPLIDILHGSSTPCSCRSHHGKVRILAALSEL
jgi:hypothetical protein